LGNVEREVVHGDVLVVHLADFDQFKGIHGNRLVVLR
jgi:hypothetical protein